MDTVATSMLSVDLTTPVAAPCSHNYRAPEAFAGQVVVVVGASNSGGVFGRSLAGRHSLRHSHSRHHYDALCCAAPNAAST